MRISFGGGPLAIHFWSGREGVALVNFTHEPWAKWAAYREQHRPGEKVAKEIDWPAMRLLATDDERGRSSFSDTFEVRWQDGTLVLSKGDLRLLTVPLAGKPTAVYLEAGSGIALRDLAFCRSGPIPAEPLAVHTVVLGQQSPAGLDWKTRVAGAARFTRLADGSVELSGNRSPQPATALVALPQPGLYEVIFKVEEATARSGIFVAAADGTLLAGVEFACACGVSATGWAFSPDAPARVGATPISMPAAAMAR